TAQQQRPPKAVTAGLVKQMVEERLAAHFQHRLGGAGGQRSEARSQAPDQEDGLLDGHAAAVLPGANQVARQSSLSSSGWSANPQFSGWPRSGAMPWAHCSARRTKLRSMDGARTPSTPATLRLG